MRPPELRFFADELIVDSFAGGGGASLGIEMALGRSPDIAINHDAEALAMHAVNHPNSLHLCEDVWAVDPKKACAGRRVGLMWLSPDCKHHSKAKGGKPVDKKIRGLAWVAVKWAKAVKPRVICLENVEEFEDWGPLLENGRPCPLRKGFTFRRFVRQLENCGYVVEHRELVAADYGSPTTRKRLFLIARSDGQPVTWPEPTHAKTPAPGLLPWHTAAECIEWSLPCPSIFERVRPLADNTLRRIARGMKRYVIKAAQPFIVPLTHHGERRVHPMDEPMPTVTGAHRGEHALVAAFMAQHNGGFYDARGGAGNSVAAPLSTITHRGTQQQVVVSSLVKLKGTCKDGQQLNLLLHTVQAGGNHYGEVRAFLLKYYGTEQDPNLRLSMHTVTAKDRFGLVTVAGEQYQIADIGMRMLQPRELFRAQGFPIWTRNVRMEICQDQKRHWDEEPARRADKPSSPQSRREQSKPVAVSAQIDLGRKVLEIRSLEKSLSLAAGAESQNSFRLPIGIDSFAALAARIASTLDQTTMGGRAEISASATHSMPAIHGNAFLKLSGSEIKEHVGDAGNCITTNSPRSTFTTSQDGLDSQSCDSTLKTLCCYAANAIVSSIQSETISESSFELEFTINGGYLIERDAAGKPFTKSAQVRMCGNSVCPPVAAAIVRAQFGVVEQQAVA